VSTAELGNTRRRLSRRIASNLAQWLSTLVRPPRQPGSPPAPRAWLSAQAGAAALWLGMVVGIMVFFDASAIGGARSLPPILIEAAQAITRFGVSGWFLWPIGSLLVLLAALSRPAIGRFANLVAATLTIRLGFLFIAIGLPGLLFSILKRLIGRVRPSELGPLYFVPFSWRPDYASMPSGHTAAAFAAAVAIGALWPSARRAMWVYAVVIAISRVLVLAHYPSDVLVGACVGVGGALLTRRFFALRRLGFRVASDGRVSALPGPSMRRIAALAARLLAHDPSAQR
jgi:membrane-associated phospholipid phosphatase